MRVLVTGATGLVGKIVIKHLLNQKHEVVVLTRNVSKAAIVLGSECRYFQWSDINNHPPLESFDGVDGIINLMGENIGARKWNEEQKKIIHHSRIAGTKSLVEAISKLKVKPSVFVSASAIGIYGNRGPEELNESSAVGDGFLADVCKDWEAEAVKAKQFGLRVSYLRTGVVLGRNGGALHKMLPPFKLGLGGPIADGQQYMSWIHVEDLASMYVEILTNKEAEGVFNGTAPYPATNEDFTKALGKVLRRPVKFRAPKFLIKLMLGEMSTLVIDGQKVLPARFKTLQFRYRYPTLDMALKETAY